MTGPVERVPLTDEQLDDLERQAQHRRTMPAPSYLALLAELRASRAREQELQQRIDKALAWCRKANPRPDLNGDLFSDLIAVLTGTEAIRSMADPDRIVD